MNYWFRNLFDFIREKETMNKKGATTTDLNNNNAVSEVSLNYKTQVGQFGLFLTHSLYSICLHIEKYNNNSFVFSYLISTQGWSRGPPGGGVFAVAPVSFKKIIEIGIIWTILCYFTLTKKKDYHFNTCTKP